MAVTATQGDFLLQTFSDVRQVRNVCIIAHVDHGKTTLSDTLLSSNGIISERSAGELRYLDSRGDERERQITMKSSAIALRWTNPTNKDDMLINLIDSPGHVDFASEVNTAARLADGALVVVDVVEGVSSQTKAVLRQAWKDDLKTILVLNKVDRLLSERSLSPDEAYEHLNRILEAVNAATQQLVAENILGESGVDSGDGGHEVVFDDEAAEKWTYHPRHGNVVFCSAIHGWGFSVPSFVDICASKLKCNRDALLKTFWGDYFYNPKTQKIVKRTPGSATRPIFSQFVLDVIWKLYAATGETLDKPYLTKMQPQCGFITPVNDLLPNCTKHVLSAWLPLSREILNRMVAIIPDPRDAAISRLPHFVHNLLDNELPLAGALRLSARDGPTAAFVTKFLLADATRNVLVSDSWDPDEPLPRDFVGLTRVFSGTLRPGMVVRYAESETGELVRIRHVFLMMGMDLIRVSAVPAGMVCGILFDEPSVAQYMTLVHAESEWIPQFQSPYPTGDASSILTVALETPVEYLEKLMDALQMLRRADPAIEIRVLDTGEHCIGCCGSEHLKRCLHDLETVYCPKIPFTVSEPLVACRETLASIPPGKLDMLVPPWVKKTDANPHLSCEPSGAITLVRKGLTISVRAIPYECEWIEDLEDGPRNWNLDELHARDATLVAVSNARGARTVLFNHDKDFPWNLNHSYHPNRRSSVDDEDTTFSRAHLRSALLTGFGLASQAGPLCEEPMRNIAFALEKVEMNEVDAGGLAVHAHTMKEALRAAFLRHKGSVRIHEPILSLDIQAEQEVVGKVYGVLHKRRTKILSEEMREGTSTFIIVAHIPLSESFGLVDELRKKGSGLAHYSAWFSHWQMLDEDPFYELSLNDEDYEDNGEAGSLERYPHNVTRKLITQIRKRKGLPVDEKIISSDSTKQRTMTRNK